MMHDWRKSSYSDGHEGACVELADLQSGLVGIRDSKHPELPHLAIPPAALAGMISDIKAGRHGRSY